MKKQAWAILPLFGLMLTGHISSVTIGTQVWSKKNLDVTTFRNGDLIPQAKTMEQMKAFSNAKEAAWCYYNFNPKNGKKYGKMYNGYAVTDPRGLAPKKWHIPNKAEFDTLVRFLGGEETARLKLKSEQSWNENGNGTNSSGFSGLPGGVTSGANFINLGYTTFFWSSSLSDDGYVDGLSLSYDDSKSYIRRKGKETPIYKDPIFVGNYISNYYYVRCVKD